MDENTLVAELASTLHRQWCDPECDSWDGRNCEIFPNGQLTAMARELHAVVEPHLNLEENGS